MLITIFNIALLFLLSVAIVLAIWRIGDLRFIADVCRDLSPPAKRAGLALYQTLMLANVAFIAIMALFALKTARALL